MPPNKGYITPDNDYSILLQVAKGSENAFSQLVAKYRNQVFGHALMFVKIHGIAEELAQDIFIKIWMNREKLTAIDSFEDYLFILSRNHLVSYMRKRNLQFAEIDNWTMASEDVKSPENQLLYKQLHEQVEKGISQLKPQQKLAYHYCKEEGYTYKEAALKMQLSPETVKWHLVAALANLRAYMKNYTGIWIFILFFYALRMKI